MKSLSSKSRTNPLNRFAFIKIIFFSFTISFPLLGCNSKTTNDQDKDIVQIKVRKEFLALNEAYHQNYTLKFTNSSTKAEPPKCLLINLNELKKFTRNIADDQANILIRLVVAHEFIHLIQDENTLSYNSGEIYRQRIREAQADILAARYAILKYEKEDSVLRDKKDPIKTTDESKFIAAYKLFFNIGKPTNSLENHPTKFERASCIYRGVKCARMEIFKNELNKLKLIKGHSEQKLLLDSALKVEQASLNIDTNYEPFSWSWQQAMLICHGNPAYLPDFVRMDTHIDTLRKTDGRFAGLVLAQTYVNDSYDDIDVTMEFRATHFRKVGNPFFDEIEFEQSKYRHLHLKPFHAERCRDKFDIPKGKGKYEIIVPPDTSALYYITSRKEINEDAKRKLDKSALDSSLDRSSFKDYIRKLNSAINSKNVAPIIVTGGMPANSGAEIYSIFFTGKVPVGEDFTSLIKYDGRLWRQYEVKLTFTSSNDSLAAVKAFERVKERLSQIMTLQKTPPQNISVTNWTFDYKRSAVFSIKEYPNNLNYLYLEHRGMMETPYKPFTIIKGDEYGGTEADQHDFVVLLIILQPHNVSHRRFWPLKYYYPVTFANK